MSKDTLVAFLSEAGQSKDGASALQQAFEEGPAAVVSLGAKNNFSFTEEDIASFEGKSTGVMSEDELESVSGGGMSAGHKMIGVEAAKAFWKAVRDGEIKL